jgi:selenide,water dikinase
VVEAMVASMKKLNRCAAQAAQATGGIRAVTDITGFGLLGHSLEMTRASGVQFQFIFSQLPFLEGARTYATEFIFPGGASNNHLYFEKDVSFATTISEDQQMLLWDPQTSGGLLLAVPADRLANFKEYCAKHQQSVWEVGQVQAGSGIIVK